MAHGKRKRLVIEPTIQYSLIRQLVVHWSLHLLATVLLVCMLQVLLGGLFHPWQHHVERIWPTVASLVITLAFLLPVYIQSSLKLSNRFAGPIHRLRRELHGLPGGSERTRAARLLHRWQRDVVRHRLLLHLRLRGLG